MALTLLALPALLGVWFRAGIRTGRWIWVNPRTALTQIEGGVWLSAVVVLVPAIALMVFGSFLANMAPSELPSISFGEVPQQRRARSQLFQPSPNR